MSSQPINSLLCRNLNGVLLGIAHRNLGRLLKKLDKKSDSVK